MIHMIRRSAIAALLGLMVFASSVQAASSQRELVEVDDILLPGGTGACDFDVMLTYGVSRVYATVFTDDQGNVTMFAVNGNVESHATNLATGQSVKIVGSGPFRIFFDADGDPTMIMATGHLVHWDPGLWVDTGRYDFSTGLTGTQTDICAELS